MTRRLLGLVGLLSTSLAFACHAPSRDDNAILMEGSADPAFTLADVRVGHGAMLATWTLSRPSSRRTKSAGGAGAELDVRLRTAPAVTATS